MQEQNTAKPMGLGSIALLKQPVSAKLSERLLLSAVIAENKYK